MSHIDNIQPRNLRVLGPDFLGNFTRGLAYDFYFTDDRKNKLSILIEILPGFAF